MTTLATRPETAHADVVPMSRYAGTAVLTRLALRRDRILIPVWALATAAMMGASVAATADLYPDAAAVESASVATNAQTPLVFMYGRIHDQSSLGALSTWKLMGLGAVAIALLAMFVVRRHTRADEEAGRLELLSAGVLGSRAALAAAFITASIAVAGTCLLSVLATGAGGLPWAGSVAFGAAWAGIGLIFVAITGLTAQLTQSSRACAGIVGTVLAATYVLRGIGDTADGGVMAALTWVSPVGWAMRVRPYAGDRWWVLLIPLLAAVVIGGFAFVLQDRRDLGEGLITTRPGPARGGAALATSTGLAWRLQRGLLLGWAVAMVGFGLLIGSVAANVDSMLGSDGAKDVLTDLGGRGTLAETFLSAEFAVIAAAVAGYAVAAVLRLGSEEVAGHAELVLATGVSRSRWYAGHLLIALLGSAGLMLVLGLATGIGLGLKSGDPGTAIGHELQSAAVQIPAVWVIAGAAAALVGVARRFAVGAWVVLAVCVVVGLFGAMLGLPSWVMAISPFTHVAHLPVEAFRVMPALVMTVVAVVLSYLGVVALRRRDIG